MFLRKILIMAAGLLAATHLQAEPFQPKYNVFQGAKIMKNVKDFGAVGDGVTKDTAAVQRAIDSGGTVYFPPGEYLCGTIYLKSNGGLHLENGAVLKASPDKEDYNADKFCPQNSSSKSEKASGAHFIVALEQHNITIEGNGRIDGNRQAFYGAKTPADCTKYSIEEKFDFSELDTHWRPAQMLFICECSDVRIRNLQLYNAPYWTCFLHGCEQVQVHGIRILNDQRTHNGDGIDIDCCRFVTVSDCIIDSGDDCITLRGNHTRLKRKQPCEYITVTNCILHTNCNAIRIGVGNGIIRNALFSNICIHDTNMGIGIYSKYNPKKGTLIENIQFENISLETEIPFLILTNNAGRRYGPAIQPIRNISFHHVRGSGNMGSRIAGYDLGDIENISFDDVSLIWGNGGNNKIDTQRSDFAEWPRVSPDTAYIIQNVKGIKFRNCELKWKTVHPSWKSALRMENCTGVKISGCEMAKPVLLNGKEILQSGTPGNL